MTELAKTDIATTSIPTVLDRKGRSHDFLYPAATFAGLLIGWQALTYLLDVPVYLLPSPWDIAREMVASSGLLLRHSATTTIEIVLGFAFSVLVGVPLAIMLTHSRAFEHSVYPLIVATQTVPKVAIAPLMLVWFGFGLFPKVIIVILVTFFPIVINSAIGFKSLNEQLLYLARSMQATPWQIFWRFRFPAALPSIFAGVKVATVLAVIGAVVAEFIGADSGLGYVIMLAVSDLNVARQFAGIIVLTLIGMIFFWLIGVIERRLMPWHISVRGESTLA